MYFLDYPRARIHPTVQSGKQGATIRTLFFYSSTVEKLSQHPLSLLSLQRLAHSMVTFECSILSQLKNIARQIYAVMRITSTSSPPSLLTCSILVMASR